MAVNNPARWLPDPSGVHSMRYWDGERWTDQVSDDPAPADVQRAPAVTTASSGQTLAIIAGVLVLTFSAVGLLVSVVASSGNGKRVRTADSSAASTTSTMNSTTTIQEVMRATTTTAPHRAFDQASFGELITSPDSFKNSPVNVVGRVFGEIDVTSSGIGFQMFADARRSEWNTAVVARPGGPTPQAG